MPKQSAEQLVQLVKHICTALLQSATHIQACHFQKSDQCSSNLAAGKLLKRHGVMYQTFDLNSSLATMPPTHPPNPYGVLPSLFLAQIRFMAQNNTTS
jgi:hypothetical protein